MRRIVAAALAAGVLGIAPSLAVETPDTDYLKRAGNFLQHCDARANPAGERPEANYVCLAFMVGLIEGYNYGAVANGNAKPYCLVRPTSLVELSDMMSTVIERGVPETMPTAAVFHFIMDANFKCPPGEEGSLAAPQNGEFALAQATTDAPLLQVTPPEALDEAEPKLPIVAPADAISQEPLLEVVDPTAPSGTSADAGDDAAPLPTPAPDTSDAGAPPPPPAPSPGPARAVAPRAVGTERDTVPVPSEAPAAEPAAPVPVPTDRPETAQPAGSATGPASAVGPSSAVGTTTTTGGTNALDLRPKPSGSAPPARPATPQRPRSATAN